MKFDGEVGVDGVARLKIGVAEDLFGELFVEVVVRMTVGAMFVNVECIAVEVEVGESKYYMEA